MDDDGDGIPDWADKDRDSDGDGLADVGKTNTTSKHQQEAHIQKMNQYYISRLIIFIIGWSSGSQVSLILPEKEHPFSNFLCVVDDDDDDNDGIPDSEDLDDDGDGVPDHQDEDHPDFKDEL